MAEAAVSHVKIHLLRRLIGEGGDSGEQSFDPRVLLLVEPVERRCHFLVRCSTENVHGLDERCT